MTHDDDKYAEAFEHILAAEDAQDAEAIQRLYGMLPDWLPGPVLPQIRQALASLRNAEQCPQSVVAHVADARHDAYTVPGTARDSIDFIKSVSYLAHVQWALEQGKARAIEELAGSQAAKDHKRSKQGSEAQASARMAALPDGHPLKSARDIQERDRIIRERGDQLRSAHPNLKPADIKRRLATWAQMSEKQVGRILGPTGK